MRLVGLDVGDVRIGVAVSDEMGWTAQGVGVVQRTRLDADLRRLGELLAPYPPERFVVGLPLTMSGRVGPQADKVQAFGRALASHFGVPVETWDERLSTLAAERTLLEADMSRAKRRRVVDKLAAVLILQSYLDRRRSSP
jgi:putative Holliday junction resolvase